MVLDSGVASELLHVACLAFSCPDGDPRLQHALMSFDKSRTAVLADDGSQEPKSVTLSCALLCTTVQLYTPPTKQTRKV